MRLLQPVTVFMILNAGAERSKLGSIRVEMGIHLRMVMRIQFVLARKLLGQARVIKIWTMGW